MLCMMALITPITEPLLLQLNNRKLPVIVTVIYYTRRWLIKVVLLLAVIPLVLFIAFDNLFPLEVRIRYSTIITADQGEILHAYLSADDKWRLPASLNDYSPELIKILLHKEDKYFYYHPGVNPIAIGRAAFQNLLNQRRSSGASTITMQVVRLLKPAPRTWFNKIKESIYALQLEWHFSKSEILNLYLNLLPYGGNIEGARAAAMLYFGKPATKLSIAEAASLAVIPNRPISLNIAKNTDAIIKARNKWLQKLVAGGVIEKSLLADALKEPLTAKRASLSAAAPHLANRLYRIYHSDSVIKTNIDLAMQLKAEQLCANYAKRLTAIDVHNLAALIIDNGSMKVKAYVGSPDFNDPIHAGQVDGVVASRSPGSTLKPLIYAAAIDAGIITPHTKIADVPVNFNGYAPENFNATYSGLISAENALALSLNIPAVKLLQQLGVNTIVQKLKQLQFKSGGISEKNSGLSLALGGCGASLEELAALYAMLANGGKFSQLSYTASSRTMKSTSIISEGAAYLISKILSSVQRPDLPTGFESTIRLPKIAWKTGTSYGRRDAWSIGYNNKYTIAVWVGNFSGKGVPELTGADRATPLLFELFNTITYNTGQVWFKPPAALDIRYVCSASGLPPGNLCTNQIADYFLPLKSTNKKCNHLIEVAMNANESMSYCTNCTPSNGYKIKVMENHSAEILMWYEQEKLPYVKIPQHNESCNRVFLHQPPKIVSPINGKTYILEKDEGALLLAAQVAAGVSEVYWYINDELIKVCDKNEKVFFKPTTERVKISCADDKGLNTNIYIATKFY
ncbi:MAG: penicillin-binding protein [Bacteroidota bacterium]